MHAIQARQAALPGLSLSLALPICISPLPCRLVIRLSRHELRTATKAPRALRCCAFPQPSFFPTCSSSRPFSVKMSSLYGRRSALKLLLVAVLTPQVLAQSCNTDQNPYCAGNSHFEQLCCPYPAVCYYANRYGAVGCCQPGQICTGTDVTLNPGTAPATTPTVQNGGYSTVTITGGVAGATVATAVGYTTTAGVIIANDASHAKGLKHATHFTMGLAMMAWIMA
jgi:hypothetical protein